MTLTEYLSQAKLTPEQFSKLVGRSVSTVYRWTAGATVPDKRAMAAVKDVTEGKVTASDFFHGAAN